MNDKKETMKDKTAGTSQLKTTLNFSHEQLLFAMRDVLDLMERCQVFGFVLGEVARAAWDGATLSGDKVIFGIKKGEYTRLTKEIIRSTRPGAVIEDNEARYLVNEVPVIIKVINRDYEFLKNLDKRDYHYDQYLFPNPFEKYYKARFIVQ